MLSFDIRSLESHAVVVDDELRDDDPVWEEDDSRPDGALHVTGRLSAAGPGHFYWHGRIEGDVALECRRCLADTRAHVSDEAHIIFVEGEEEEADDPDVYRLDARALELDLRPAIREQWLVAAPLFALGRDDCKGLCPHCGADLNAGEHTCDQQGSDQRWDALRNAR